MLIVVVWVKVWLVSRVVIVFSRGCVVNMVSRVVCSSRFRFSVSVL